MNKLVALLLVAGVARGGVIPAGQVVVGVTSSQYHAQDELGQYAYGYSGGPSAKEEIKTADGITRGGYDYIDANGIVQSARYVSDPVNGFRVAATNLPVGPAVPDGPEEGEVAVVAPSPAVVAPAVEIPAPQHEIVAPAPTIVEAAPAPVVVTAPAPAPIAVAAPAPAPVHAPAPIVEESYDDDSVSIESAAFRSALNNEAAAHFAAIEENRIRNAIQERIDAESAFNDAIHTGQAVVATVRTAPAVVASGPAVVAAAPAVVASAPVAAINSVPAVIAAPAPVVVGATASQYHAQDELGQYAYGYAGGPSAKEEVKTADGITRGGYDYIDAHGVLQSARYVSDEVHGFRVAATNLPVQPAPAYIADTAEVEEAKARLFHAQAAHIAKL